MASFAKSDLQLVRDYVTAADHLQYSQLPEDIVAVHITHSNLVAKHLDIRLNLHLTVRIKLLFQNILTGLSYRLGRSKISLEHISEHLVNTKS